MILLTGGESMERLFDLDWQLLADSCLTIIAVFILFLALSYFLFNPARKLLNSRKEKIQGELETAKKDMEDARRLKAEYESKIQNNENQIIAQAKEEAAAILDRARTEAELEKQKMSDDVKKEMVSIASLMAGKVVSASIDTTVQNQLIDETLKEMGDKTWLS